MGQLFHKSASNLISSEKFSTENVLKFQTLKFLSKRHSLCYFDNHFVNSSPENQHFIGDIDWLLETEIRTFTVLNLSTLSLNCVCSNLFI